jgi:hypothetical protein
MSEPPVPSWEKQLSDRDFVSEITFTEPTQLFFSFWRSIFVSREPGNRNRHPTGRVGRCYKSILGDTAVNTPVPCSPGHGISHIGFSWPELFSPAKDVNFPRQGHQDLDLGVVRPP